MALSIIQKQHLYNIYAEINTNSKQYLKKKRLLISQSKIQRRMTNSVDSDECWGCMRGKARYEPSHRLNQVLALVRLEGLKQNIEQTKNKILDKQK